MRPRQISGSHASVLHVITPSRMAGAETLLGRLVSRQVTRGQSIAVLCSRREEVIEQFARRGVAVRPGRISGKANPLALPALANTVRAVKPKLLHSHLSTASWWCGWLERLGGPPSLGHVHGFTSALWHRRQRLLLAVSSAVKDHLVRQGIAANRIRVVHNPVDPVDVQPARSPWQVRSELETERSAPVVGSFAHFSEKKGWRDLVEAAALILKHHPRTVFWFVGDGPLRPEIQRRADQLGCAESVRFPGFRSDVADLMNAVDLMALPSHREPFGLVYLEAGLLEKPVIACTAGGAPEVVGHEENGLLVSPRDVSALAAAIAALIENRDRATLLGRRGRERALDRFGWERYLTALEEIYAELSAPN